MGTPRAVSDASGAVVKVLDYDAFGTLNSDSNPSFDLPLGFGGGLSDRVTGLVRFGFRDYDPVAGRWTARDPAIYGGSQANLYAYVGNNPLSLRDPSGLFCFGASKYDVFGGGAQFCIDDKGISGCGEIGLGYGESIDIQPLGELAKTSLTESGELKLGIPGLSTTAGLELDICTGKFKPILKEEIGATTVDLVDPENTGANENINPSDKRLVRLPSKLGEVIQGNVAAKGCYQFKL